MPIQDTHPSSPLISGAGPRCCMGVSTYLAGGGLHPDCVTAGQLGREADILEDCHTVLDLDLVAAGSRHRGGCASAIGCQGAAVERDLQCETPRK